MNLYRGVYSDLWVELDFWSDRGRNQLDFWLRFFAASVITAIFGLVLFIPSLFIWLYQFSRWLFKKREPVYPFNRERMKKNE